VIRAVTDPAESEFSEYMGLLLLGQQAARLINEYPGAPGPLIAAASRGLAAWLLGVRILVLFMVLRPRNA
jgi:hypothetical protein